MHIKPPLNIISTTQFSIRSSIYLIEGGKQCYTDAVVRIAVLTFNAKWFRTKWFRSQLTCCLARRRKAKVGTKLSFPASLKLTFQIRWGYGRGVAKRRANSKQRCVWRPPMKEAPARDRGLSGAWGRRGTQERGRVNDIPASRKPAGRELTFDRISVWACFTQV